MRFYQIFYYQNKRLLLLKETLRTAKNSEMSMHNVKKEREREKKKRQFVCTSCFKYALLADYGFSWQMQTARQKALQQRCRFLETV